MTAATNGPGREPDAIAVALEWIAAIKGSSDPTAIGSTCRLIRAESAVLRAVSTAPAPAPDGLGPHCPECGQYKGHGHLKRCNLAPPTPAPAPDADALVRRFACFTMEDGVYESATGEHVAYADYAKLRATIEQQARELAGLRSFRAGVLDALEIEHNDTDTVVAEINAIHLNAERAEYDFAAARECIAAADAMREGMYRHGEDGGRLSAVSGDVTAFDAARAAIKETK